MNTRKEVVPMTAIQAAAAIARERARPYDEIYHRVLGMSVTTHLDPVSSAVNDGNEPTKKILKEK